jgi:hypothetical protein
MALDHDDNNHFNEDYLFLLKVIKPNIKFLYFPMLASLYIYFLLHFLSYFLQILIITNKRYFLHHLVKIF